MSGKAELNDVRRRLSAKRRLSDNGLITDRRVVG